MIIYNQFLNLNFVVAYVYMAWSFVINFMTKMWGQLSFFTIKMLACGKIQIEQMTPHGLPRLVGGP
jgi:hypothetical protein